MRSHLRMSEKSRRSEDNMRRGDMTGAGVK